MVVTWSKNNQTVQKNKNCGKIYERNQYSRSMSDYCFLWTTQIATS